MSWLDRQRARRRLKREVGLWYHPEYAPRFLRGNRTSKHPLERAQLALGQLMREKLIRPRDIQKPAPATFAHLARVHPISYLEETDTPARLSAIFGAQPEEIHVDEVLHAQRLAVGGTIAAARAAATGTQTAVNLGGGFHHAAPDMGAGFCVYNDIAVAIEVLRSDGHDVPMAIVDVDYHQGDGNLATFQEDERILTYSLHGSVWSHLESVKDVNVLVDPGADDETYLHALGETLLPALHDHRPRFVFVVAGADVLAGDTLGDFRLTTKGVLQRDRLIIEEARRLGAPCIVTLGGGYNEQGWQSTANLVRWLLTDTTSTMHHEETDLRAEFSRIAASIHNTELTADDWSLTEEDVMGDLAKPRRATRVLDYYSRQGVEFALERYGILDVVRSLGFSHLDIDIDPSDPAQQSIRVSGAKDGQRHRLVELVLRRRRLDDFELLSIEWMRLQDPTASFSLERPPLPGQEYPGLGTAEMTIELLVQACHRLDLDGLVSHPSRYHVALGSEGWHFLDPELEGRFRAFKEALATTDLLEAAQLMERGLTNSQGETVEWEPGDLVLPVSERLIGYLQTHEYRERVEAAYHQIKKAGLRVP